MFSVPDLLDRAKKAAGVQTDYALAKVLGHRNQANVSAWRNEKATPDERAIEALCKLSGDDPEYVAAMIQGMRAANDDAAHLWRRVADRLKGGGAAAIAAVILAPMLVMATSDGYASTALPTLDAAALCIMSNKESTQASRSLHRRRYPRQTTPDRRCCSRATAPPLPT